MPYVIRVLGQDTDDKTVTVPLTQFLKDHLTSEDSFYSRSLGAVEAVDAKVETLTEIVGVLLQHATKHAIEEALKVINRNVSYPRDEGKLLFVPEVPPVSTEKAHAADPLEDPEAENPARRRRVKRVARSVSHRDGDAE